MSGADATPNVGPAIDAGDLPRASQRWPHFELACHIESYADGDECTVFPADADDETLTTTWITADEGSFVALEDLR